MFRKNLKDDGLIYYSSARPYEGVYEFNLAFLLGWYKEWINPNNDLEIDGIDYGIDNVVIDEFTQYEGQYTTYLYNDDDGHANPLSIRMDKKDDKVYIKNTVAGERMVSPK